MQTLKINPIFKSYGRPRKEMTARGVRKLTPKFDVEACTDMNGERCYIVRFRGHVVSTIPAQLTRQAARDKAAHYWMVARNPDRYPHIYCPF